ncbi:FUSC family protein [Clostridium sp.]|uniref:FUSC family protein n=1 Tax=Clostridium sp. TaxID=1506 RepID=UPI00351FDEA6
MFDYLIKKYNVNVTSMIRNGTVAVITMLGVGILFGSKNVMLAFPIALTSTVIGRQNFYVKPFNRIIRILALDLIIVLIAFISSLNIWIGIIIDFFAIFFIVYIVTSPYDATFYKPFIMLYVFTQYANISIYELPNRLLSVVFGALVIIAGTYIKKSNGKEILGNSVNSAFLNIKKQIENIIERKIDEKLTENCSKIMMDLVYKVYITRYKRYLTTNLGTIQFKLYLNIEYLNIYLSKIYEYYEKGRISKEQILDLLSLIELIINYLTNKCKLEDVTYKSKFINEKYKKDSELFNEILLIVTSIVDEIKEAEILDNKEADKIYKEWERTYLDKPKEIFKEYFVPSSIRFKFAMRMAITLTFSIFIAELLGYYKIIWAIITIMSIMQPYYEDTITKTRERIKGNIIAILFTGIIIHLFHTKWITILILVISLYLLYGFKEYYKISLFAAMASICMSSLTVNLNKLLVYRIFYVIMGVIIVLLANKYIFPYRLKDGIIQLVRKVLKYDEYLVDTSREYLNKSKGDNYIRDLIIHTTLLTQKLYLRNLQYRDDNITEFIDKNNEFVVKIGYKVLMVYKKKYNENIFKYISELYDDFNGSVRKLIQKI